MIEPFEIEGEWWLPENPENKVKGKLIFAPGQDTELKLSGFQSYLVIKGGYIGTKDSIISKEIILGISDEGEKVTLHKCRAFILPVEEQSFDIDYIFRGEHFENKNDIKFKALIFKYLHFSDWTKSYTKFGGNKTKFAETNTRENLKLFFVLQDNAELPIDELNNLNNMENSIILYPKELKNYFDYDYDMRLMISFFSFAISNRTYLLSLRGLTENHDEVEVISRIRGISNIAETLVERKFLFRLSDVHNQIEDLVKSWFVKGKQLKLDIVFDLFLRTLYFPEMHFEADFLVLAQAIETFHHRISYNKNTEKHEDQYVSDEKYKTIYDKVCETIDQGLPNNDKNSALKDYLKSHLKLGNKFSLNRRLKEIDRKYNLTEVFFSKLKVIRNWDAFLKNVVDSRNYYTHWDEKIKQGGNVVSGEELFWLTQKLRVLLTICILKEIGFEDEEILYLLKSYIDHNMPFILNN